MRIGVGDYGYPKEICDIFDRAVKMLGGDEMPLLFGPSHLVWEDGNMADEHIDFCLRYDTGELTKKEVKVVHWSLHELKKIPLHVRDKING